MSTSHYENLFQALEAKVIATMWEQKRALGRTNFGETLFPHKKASGLSLRYFEGEIGAPVALKPSQLDTLATLRDHIGVQELQYEMPFFREGSSLREKLRQDFLAATLANNAALYNAILQRIYDDRTALLDGALVQAERMRAQLLQKGTISIAVEENRVAYEYDFGFPNEHKMALPSTERWDQHGTSDPYVTIENVKILMEPVTDITRAICSPKNFRHMIRSEALRKDLFANTVSGNGRVTREMAMEYIDSSLGVTFNIVSDNYRLKVGGEEYPYWEDGIVTFIPDGFLGNTHFGTTPEELDLISNVSRARVAIVDKGIAVTTFTEEHPVNHVTNVSAIMMPSFEQMKKVCIVQVY